jgi:epoxyqueuosine reductase
VPSLTLLKTVRQLGFELYGIIPAGAAKTFPAFERRIESGRYASITYLAEQREARRHPASILPGVKSLIMLGVSYAAVLNSTPHPVKQLTGIADYARGIDYHTWIRRRFKVLADTHRELFPNGRCRGVTDTAPLLEKEFAAQAGLGFIGKNTLLINDQLGSKLFLGAFLSTEELDTGSKPNGGTEPKTFSCGNCTKCIEACPGGALTAPYILDSRQCISYRNQFLAENTGSYFFGCDICQDVCPHNRHIPKEAAGSVDPLTLDTETLRTLTAGSPVERRFRG